MKLLERIKYWKEEVKHLKEEVKYLEKELSQYLEKELSKDDSYLLTNCKSELLNAKFALDWAILNLNHAEEVRSLSLRLF